MAFSNKHFLLNINKSSYFGGIHSSKIGKVLGIVFLNLLLLTSSCGVQFKEASLYDGIAVEEPAPKPKSISLAVEPFIFEDDESYFWLPGDSDCTTGGLTTEAIHSGTSALKINWERNPANCEWAGFGIGWDNWSGKDLSEVYEYTAIQMYIRSQKGKMFGLPMVLTLEDYSGNMAWSYTGNGYFEKYFIDEEWQKIVVPLKSFDLEEDGINISNIKQLMFELQQAGGIYLDDIQLVFYEPTTKEPWLEGEVPTPSPLNFPVQLFDDAFINDNGWGLHQDNCQKIELSNSEKSEGTKSIHATWDTSKEDCYMVAIGISWNRWFPQDLSEVTSTAIIEFEIKSSGNSMDKAPVKIGFEDYDRATSLVELDGKFVDGGKITNEWKQVRIPFSALPKGANFSKIKQLVIKMEDAGEVYIDNIQLVRKNS